MIAPKRLSRIIAIVISLVFLLTPLAAAQEGAPAGDKPERDRAIALFNDQKFLEALPLFEDLASKSPNDNQMQLGLGACLVEHSATVADPDAAAKERARALQVLTKARDLGNNSQLLLNLMQVLQSGPASGPIKYSEIPAANEAMHAAEAAFARRDFDAAIKDYSRALDLDPKNAAPALFIGDSYFAKKDFANAGAWYLRATQINPDSETAYRYYADMLTKSGDLYGARTKSIQAVVAEPYNPITWRALGVWANAAHVRLVPIHVNVPNNVSQQAPGKITITIPSGEPNKASSAWLAYSMAQALWHGDKFQKEFPQEKQYRHSLAEEADCLTSAAKVWLELTAKNPTVPSDADLVLLLKIYQADMIEPYVLLNAADEGISHDYDAYRQKNRSKLEQYLGQFVVPPAPLPSAVPKP